MSISHQEALLNFFNQKEYSHAVSYAIEKDISPVSDPQSSNIVAASLFQLSRFEECLLWCEGLSSTYNSDPSFASMYGATLRRLNRYEEASSVFESSLQVNSDNPALLNNYANLLIDAGKLNQAKSILDDLISKYPDYEDAKSNLGRVQFYLQESKDKAKTDSNQHSSHRSKLSVLEDPLSFAFSEDEVSQAGGAAQKLKESTISSDKSSAFSSLALDQIAERSGDHELADFVALIRATSEHDPKQALSDLNSLHRMHGPKAFLHELAVEVYIRIKDFQKLRCMLLFAFS